MGVVYGAMPKTAIQQNTKRVCLWDKYVDKATFTNIHFTTFINNCAQIHAIAEDQVFKFLSDFIFVDVFNNVLNLYFEWIPYVKSYMT